MTCYFPKMSDIEEITEKLLRFWNERGDEQFHNSEGLALALNIKNSGLLEAFLWKSSK